MIKAFILCKNKSAYPLSLQESLQKNVIDAELIIDFIPNYEQRDSELKKLGFTGSAVSYIKDPSAWDVALFEAKKQLDKYDHFFFIEDDVFASDVEIFSKVIHECVRLNYDLIAADIYSKRSNPWWGEWIAAKDLDTLDPWQSFNPFCMVSKRLLADVLAVQEKRKALSFLEIAFATIANDNGYTMLDFKKSPELKDYFGTFLWRPTTISFEEKNSGKILHPVRPE